MSGGWNPDGWHADRQDPHPWDRRGVAAGCAMTTGLSSIDQAAADRIAAAFVMLESELAGAGIPVAEREDVIILLAARRRQDRIRPELEARARRIVAQRAAAREVSS